MSLPAERRDANGRAGGRSSARCARPWATLTWLRCSSRGSPLLLVLLRPAGPALAGEVMPLDQVRPGMQGVGRTVFEGARVDEFGVRILGVLENAVGPRQSLILARLEGGPLAQTGVIAGMSGSPVFVDGKLVGAVAYAFPFGKEPIAGITPIADMIEAAGSAAPRAASTRLHPGRGRPRRAARPRVGGGGPAPAAAGARPRRLSRRAAAPRRRRGHAQPGRAAARLLRLRGRHLRLGARRLLRDGLRAGDGGRRRDRARAPPRPRPRRGGGGLPRGGRPRPVGDRDAHPHRRRPCLRVRAPVLQPRPHPLPPEEGVGLLDLPEPPGLLEDRRRARRGGHDGPGPVDHDLRPPRRSARA